MSEFNIDETERSHTEIEARMTKTEEEGFKNVLKHFDRIHDKLFSINTMFIAGFLALIKISENIPTSTIFVPVGNMLYLIWIEFKMLNKSRFEASIKSKTEYEINKWGKSISKINYLSLLSIVLTVIVASYFVCFVFKSDKWILS